MEDKRWAVIWSDDEELKKVISSSKSQIKKFRDELQKGQITVKTPFLEYSTGQQNDDIDLDFEKETVFLESLKISTREDIISVIKKRQTFKPFIALVQGIFVGALDLAEWVKTEHRYILEKKYINSDVLIENSKRIINSQYWQIINEFKDIAGKPGTKFAISLNDKRYHKEVLSIYKGAEKDIINHVNKIKPYVKGTFKGITHYTYFFDDAMMQVPTVLFHEDCIDSLPSTSSFEGKLVGVFNLIANAPFKNMSPIIFRPVIISIPWTMTKQKNGSN